MSPASNATEPGGGSASTGGATGAPRRHVAGWGWCPRHRGHILFFFGLCLLGAATVVLPLALICARSPVDEQLDRSRDGEVLLATAIVERVEQSPHRWVDGGAVYCLPYHFRTERGELISGSSLTRDSWLSRKFFDGSAAEVEYLARDPRASRVRGTRRALTLRQALLVPGAIAYLAWVFLVLGALRSWSYRRLFTEGRVARGQVENVIAWASNDIHPCWASVGYHYELPGDRRRPGRALVFLPWRGALREEMAFPVLVDPRRPAAHVPMGLYGLKLGT